MRNSPKFSEIVINIDGGSRDNPGPAAFGAVIRDIKKGIKREFSQYIGVATNNEAEYQALIFALKKTKALFGKDKIRKLPVEIRSDSELLIKQIQGEYKIKEPTLQPLFLKAWNLKVDFGNLKFSLIPRSENKEADKLVNEALSAQEREQKLF